MTRCARCGELRREAVYVELRGPRAYSLCSMECLARWAAAIVAVMRIGAGEERSEERVPAA